MAHIVVAGEPAEAGLRDTLISALRQCGHVVDSLALGPWSPAWLVSAAFRKPILGGGFRHELRRRIDVLAESGSADLVLVIKGALINSALIDYLRLRFDSPVVCWNPDSPFDDALSNCGAGIREAIGCYDAYITWAHDVAELLSKVASRVLVVPFAWDPEIMAPVVGHGLAADRIVFVGTATEERIASLRSLAHLRPMVFGDRWTKIEGVDIRPPVRGIEFCKVVGEARWNINFLRPQNARSHNMRTFELVGAGGNQVAPQTEDHRRFLGDDSRTVLFQGKHELECILRSDPTERSPRLPGFLEGQTYEARVRQILDSLKIL